MTVIVPIIGDTHSGSTIGLCTPYVQLDDGGSYRASALQRAVWRAFKNDFCKDVAELRESREAKVVTVFNGDVVDGDHHDTSQIITRNPSTQLRIAYEVHEPLIELSDIVYVVRGTSAHTGKSASMEEKFAEDIGAVKHTLTGTSSWWNLLLNIEGVVMDIAHHQTMGRMPWTMKASAIRLAAKTLFTYADSGRKLPDLVIRSHQHRHLDSYDAHIVRAIALPCWQGKTEFINRIDPTAVPDIGGIIIICDKGKYEVITKKYPFRVDPPRNVMADLKENDDNRA